MKRMSRIGVGVIVIALVLTTAGCGSRTKKGAGAGAVLGGVAGAVIGHQSGKKTEGAVIGAIAGAAIGGAIGHRLDKQAAELAEIAETRRTDEGIIVTLASNKINFDSGSSSVKPESRDVLVRLAGVIKKYPEDVILVSGHTDSDGSADYNLDLSRMRAQAVADILSSNGVPIATIEVRGYGETQPVASNDTGEGKSLNRRVELSITVDESKLDG